MPIFNNLSKAQIQQHYTHYGWFCNLVPIYVSDVDGECNVQVRNWVPEWTLDVAAWIADTIPNDVGYPIRITGRIEKEGV